MDRQIVYVGAIPLDTDQLLQSQNTMVAIGYLAKMLVGDSAVCADGLLCTPGSGLSVQISAGSMTEPGVIDAGFFGALPPNADPLVKIGINSTSTTLPVVGAGSYLVYGSVAEVPGGETVNAYYNASNPEQTLYGPAGNGSAQASVLQQRVVLGIAAGTAAPAGSAPLWAVDVPAGATSIDPTMITIAPNAPFVAVKLPGAAPLASPNFSGFPAAPTQALGDASNLIATTEFVATSNRHGRAAWGVAGSMEWVCPAGVSQVLFRGWGPGGAGGAGSGTSGGGGGGGGGYGEILIDVVAGQTYPVVVGTGGSSGGLGTATSFAGLAAISAGGNGSDARAALPGAGGAPGGSSPANASSVSGMGVSAGQPGFLLGGVSAGGAGGASFGSAQPFPIPGAATGVAGTWPGGGGAGGANGAGGNGAAGLVVLEWSGKPSA